LGYKLEKHFLLETRYENDKKDMKIFLYFSIIFPIYLILYFAIILSWRKQYRDIRKMRDEQREIELLDFIQTKKYKNKKYFYAYYALVDLKNKQVKDIVVRKIIEIDEKPFSGDSTAYFTMEYGRILAYIERNY